MDEIYAGGTPFSVLIDRAVKLKSSQTSHLRAEYDRFPSFYQNSIIPRQEVIEARELKSFEDRLAAANKLKEEGNSEFRNGRFIEASTKYEMALAVFRYLDNTNPEWKKEGIKDEYINQISYEGETAYERQKVNQFLVNCYNNIALASIKSNFFKVAISACDYAITIDGTNDKSYLLRSRARIAPKSSGSLEQELALSDLKSAIKHNPNNNDARKMLHKLTCDLRSQRSKDKRTFKGLFNRGEIYSCQDLSEEKEARRKKQEEDAHDPKQRDIILGKQLAQLYDERGMIKEKEAIEESLKHAIQERDKKIDFRNPTEKMVQDAESMGVDLRDPQTIQFLEELQSASKNGSSLKRDEFESMLHYREKIGAFASHVMKIFSRVLNSFQSPLESYLIMLLCGGTFLVLVLGGLDQSWLNSLPL